MRDRSALPRGGTTGCRCAVHCERNGRAGGETLPVEAPTFAVVVEGPMERQADVLRALRKVLSPEVRVRSGTTR